MDMNLEDLLASHAFDSDTRLLSIQWSTTARLTIELEGYRWWQSNPDGGRGRLSITFDGIMDSCIRIPTLQDTIDGMKASRDSLFLASYGSFDKIFCAGPLSDPNGFFLSYISKASAYRSPLEYLSGDAPLETWLRNTQTSSYALLTAPRPLVTDVLPLLESRGAPYRIAKGDTRYEKDAFLHVSWNDSWVVCRTAKVRA
jgi:hypothetical protein